MIDKGGCGHSQEVVRSASGHMGLAAARGGIKLKAGRGRENSQEISYSLISERDKMFVTEEPAGVKR